MCKQEGQLWGADGNEILSKREVLVGSSAPLLASADPLVPGCKWQVCGSPGFEGAV